MKSLILLYLLCYGGSLVSLARPYVGLLIYVAFAIMRPDYLWRATVPPGNYSRTVAISLLVGWVLHGLGRWKFGRATAIVVLLVAYMAWSVLGVTVAIDAELAWSYVDVLSKIVLPFLVGMTLIDSLPKLRQLAWVIVVSQGFVAYELNLTYLAGYNQVREEGFGSLDNNGVSITMDTCIGMAFFLGLQARRWWFKALAFGSAAAMGHVVLMSNSRGGMLSLLITGAVVFLLIPKRPRHYLAFAAAVLLMIRFTGPEVIARFQTSFADGAERDGSADSRLELWGNCWDVMLRQPILGIGPKNWPLIAPEYGWKLGKEAHTHWLQTGAQQGFPGLAMLVGFYLICIARLWPLTKESYPVPDPFYRDVARMVIASLFGFGLSAQFVTVEALETPYYITLLGAGALKILSVDAVRDGAKPA